MPVTEAAQSRSPDPTRLAPSLDGRRDLLFCAVEVRYRRTVRLECFFLYRKWATSRKVAMATLFTGVATELGLQVALHPYDNSLGRAAW